MAGSVSLPEERRRFSAEFAGSIWYGDVLHGPRLPLGGRVRKTYLVSLIDDASRLIAHSAFCLGETALDIEGVLKQALLKRPFHHYPHLLYIKWFGEIVIGSFPERLQS